MEYKIDDRVLPILSIPNPCPVRVVIDDKYVRLFVGSRDWQWAKETGKLIGSGAGLCLPVTESGAKRD